MKPIFPSIIFILILALCLPACEADIALHTGEARVAEAAAGIAVFDPPAGYEPEFRASLKGYTLVSYTPGDGSSHLYLVQSQEPTDAGKLAQAMDDIVPGGSDPEFRMTVLETRTVNLRGQGTTLVISEGTNSEGETYRQALAAFEGDGGPALLVFSEPVDRWDLEKLETLLASIQ